MNEYSYFPPLSTLLYILKNCPRGAYVYVYLWKNKKKNNLYSMQRKNIHKYLGMSPTVFKNILHSLSSCDLVTYEEMDRNYFIEVKTKDEKTLK